jgi:GcrA cell cycle regulator
MSADPWSRERIAVLEKLWAEGATAQSIAGRLGGVSRAAVLGKIFRLRLDAGRDADKDAGKSASVTVAPANQTRQPADAKRVEAAAPVRRRRSGKRDASPERQTLAERTPARTRGKSLLELTNDSCRWPHGRPGTARFHFCGAPGADLENGMPYCAQHAQRAYLKHPSFAQDPKAQDPKAQDPKAQDPKAQDPKASVTGTSQLTDGSAGRRRYAWRGLVRHPAARWK